MVVKEEGITLSLGQAVKEHLTVVKSGFPMVLEKLLSMLF
jgi:hypothetical protein